MIIAQPIYFGSTNMPLQGWLHQPAAAMTSHGVGIVLCGPWGREEASAHLTLRHLAKEFSHHGWSSIRFDWLGEGDSAGDPLQDGGLDAWTDSVGLAIEELKRRTGVTQVVLLGVRLGATLACLAAQGRDDVAGLIAVAPIAKGRTFVRELSAMQAATGADALPDSYPGMFQSGGYVMATETRDALSAVDLTQLICSPEWRILVLDRDDMPASSAWLAALESQGGQLEHRKLSGYADMMADPHRVVVPQELVEACLSWMSNGVSLASGTTDQSKGLASDQIAQLPIRMPAPGAPCGFVQERVIFLDDAPAIGVLSQPVDGQSLSGHAVLILNAGSTRRIGPSRMSVTIARQWASLGHTVMRLDLAGLGDSEVRPGCTPNMSYPFDAMSDVKAAVAYLLAQPGVKHVHALGLCAGAYHALKAARDGVALSSITLINPLVFFDAEGWTAPKDGELSTQKVHSTATHYRQSALSFQKWLKLLRGQIMFGALFKVLTLRVLGWIESHLRDLGRRLNVDLKNDIGTELRHLTERGVRVTFVIAKGDPGEAMLTEQAGSTLRKLREGGLLQFHLIGGADHVFSDVVPRNLMLNLLDQNMRQIAAVTNA